MFYYLLIVVRCMYYIKNDVNYMKVQFYLQGTRRRGTVNVEVKEVSHQCH